MIKYPFKQACSQLKQQPLLTVVSVLGTALTICLIMVMVMQQQIKVVPFAPESNRDRLLHVRWGSVNSESAGKKYTTNAALSYKTAKACFKELNSAEAVSIYSMNSPMQVKLPLAEGKGVDVKQTDASFFQIFDFAFVDGKPFMEADSDAGLPVAVITESVAKYLFNTSAVSGREVLINSVPYRIAGVVKDVSSLASTAYAQVWIPYLSTQITTSQQFNFMYGHLGTLRVIILAKQRSDFEVIRAECDRRVETHNKSIENFSLFFRGEPDDQLTMSEHNGGSQAPDMKGYFLHQLMTILILLLVPAINLSSMTQSRLRQRVAEIGVRRSFGAARSDIMWQIVIENLVLTLIAAFIGLVLCFLFATVCGHLLFANSSLMYLNTAPIVEWQMLFNVSTFIYALFFSLLLNLLSSGLPAWKASKTSIVNALIVKTH